MSAPEQQPAEASAASASSDAAAAAAAEAAAASTWSSGGSIAPGSTPLASPDEKQRNMAGMYPQLEGMLRGAAL
ncbi:hypothetical protein FA09DRAFT_331931 [Tilletiopsis washingtonensis]|uniref:Uncharacterized protein n=1 Tax=Tilletiopsis washingtonensis TaxID=58919 RepID=A0A316Z225_9BASI|nr:hypothetical protein FA09DRAFT_331931 [Tilletiopsis washingtonensis]PWN95609.1 hypothetical protein FA09DRAFT_331931 [Tilletiopsis washingtonensis]